MTNDRTRAQIVDTQVHAGFPGVVEESTEEPLDLNEHLAPNSTSTFFVRVDGDSMVNAGIYHGDMLVVDRSLQPKHSDIVVARLDGAFTVKRLYRTENVIRLIPENPMYRPMTIHPETDFSVWGVVTWVLHKTHHNQKFPTRTFRA